MAKVGRPTNGTVAGLTRMIRVIYCPERWAIHPACLPVCGEVVGAIHTSSDNPTYAQVDGVRLGIPDPGKMTHIEWGQLVGACCNALAGEIGCEVRPFSRSVVVFDGDV